MRLPSVLADALQPLRPLATRVDGSRWWAVTVDALQIRWAARGAPGSRHPRVREPATRVRTSGRTGKGRSTREDAVAEGRKDRCETCKFWDRDGSATILSRSRKYCRRHAPIAIEAKVFAQWALTKPAD